MTSFVRLEWEHGSMAIDQFTERLAIVHTRFAANLNRKLDNLDRALPQLSGERPAAIEALATAHRNVHALCGIGPTVGFVATGQAARLVERILIQPLRAKRGLTDSEVVRVRDGLRALRAAARNEMPITNGPTK